MKKGATLHFTRSMYVYESRNINLLSQSEKNKIKEHKIDTILRMLRKYLTKKNNTLEKINNKRRQYK